MENTADHAIRKRAHQIWEDEGRPHGKHEEHWRRARSEMHGLEDLPKTDSERKAPVKPKASSEKKPRSSKSAT